MPVHIRKALPNDAPGITAVLETVTAERLHSAIVQPWSAAQQRQYLESLSPREAFHVALNDTQQIVGYQSLDLWSPGLGSMAHVAQIGTFLHPEYRGLGIGKLLWNATAQFARTAAYRKVVIQVRASNATAQSFYRNLGFQLAGRLTRQVVIDGIEDDEILMELFL